MTDENGRLARGSVPSRRSSGSRAAWKSNSGRIARDPSPCVQRGGQGRLPEDAPAPVAPGDVAPCRASPVREDEFVIGGAAPQETELGEVGGERGEEPDCARSLGLGPLDPPEGE